MASLQQQEGIPSERVFNQAGTNTDDVQCLICHDILWKPVACQTCEAAFCSTCIHRWLTTSPNICPNRCEPYVERKCSPLTARLLGRLQTTCSYKSNGCEQNISYDALEKHEVECEYQQQQCSGCRSQILKKDFVQHTSTCASIELICDDCEMKYKRGDATTQHSENICLKTQLRQVRKQCKEMSLLLNYTIKTITFNDLSHVAETAIMPTTYKQFKWTGLWYSTESYFMRERPKSGYVTASIPGFSPYIVYALKKSKISSKYRNETFTLVFLTAHAAWNDNLKLSITGYRNSIQISSHTATLGFGKPQRISLDWKSIDKVTLEPSGGISHSDTGWTGTHFVLSEVMIL